MGEIPAYAKYIAEFVGTYLLIFTVGCNVIKGDPTWAVTSIAVVLMVSIYALGGVSGANFNPAVSLTLGLSGKLDWANVGIYMVTQIIAGIAAGFSYYALFGTVFNLAPQGTFTCISAGVAEVLYTFMLCFVVLNVAASPKTNGNNEFYGLAIGFVVIAGGYGAGSISGGCFNPAVALGIDVSSAGLGFGWSLAYVGYEFLGAALASGLHRVVRPKEYGGEDGGAVASLVSEFLGTYFLVVTVGFNVLGGSKAGAFSIAASLMCMIYALGNVSGAHFNPAVTLAIACSGRDKIGFGMAATYMATQIVAGIAASMTYTFTIGAAFPLGPGGHYNWGQCAVAEIVFTFILCFVVLSVATTEEPSKQMFGLAIGSCVTVGGVAIGAISGGSLNPAVSFGIDTGNAVKGGAWMNCLVYTGFEFVGAILAAGVFMATRPGEYGKGAGARSFRSLREKEAYGAFA